MSSNAKLPDLGLTQRRLKTLELAGKTLAVQDKGPEAVTKQGQAVSGKERETKKKKSPKTQTKRTEEVSDRNSTNLLRRSGRGDGGLRPHVFS